MPRVKESLTLWFVALLVPVLLVLALPTMAWAQLPSQVNGNFFFQFGAAQLFNDRSDEAFTDFNCRDTGTSCATNKGGWYVGGGLDIPLWQLPWGHMVMGTINIQFKRWEQGDKTFLGPQGIPSPTAPESGGFDGLKQKGGFSFLTIMVHPKYRFDNFVESGKIQPWIIPIGWSVQGVLSPSEAINVLEFSPVFGVGVDYLIHERIVIGVDSRYFPGTGQTGIVTDNITFGGFVGIRW